MDDLTLQKQKNKLNRDFDNTIKRINSPQFDIILQNIFTNQYNHLVDFVTNGEFYESILYFNEVENGLNRINNEITETYSLIKGDSANFINTISNIVLHGSLPQSILYGNIVNNRDTNNLCDIISDINADDLKIKKRCCWKIHSTHNPRLREMLKAKYPFYLTTNQFFLDGRFKARIQLYKLEPNKYKTSIYKWAFDLNKIMNDYLTKIQVIDDHKHLTKSRVQLFKDSRMQRDYFRNISFKSAIPMYLVFKPIFKSLLNMNDDKILHDMIGSLLFIKLVSLPIMYEMTMYRNSAWNNDQSVMDTTTYLLLMIVILDNFFTASPKPTKACVQTIQKLFKLDKASNKFFAD